MHRRRARAGVEPEILLLDEPLSNLDASLREEMRFEIRRLHEAFNITTLYVTHDQAEAMVIADRVAVLDRGRVAQIGSAEELYEAPSSRFVAEFIGKTNLVEGRAEDADTFTRGRLRIPIDGAGLSPGAATILSIRPHQIELRPVTADDPARAPLGALRGTVLRARSSATRGLPGRIATSMSSSGSPAPAPAPRGDASGVASHAAHTP